MFWDAARQRWISSVTVGLVRFTLGARTNWRSHANGQLLVCTDGVGLVASRDGTTIRLRAGESVWTPPGQQHCHGGTADTMMHHYAILDETPPATPPRGWSR
jgi:quercetin dioxygenase-like cupin family protein